MCPYKLDHMYYTREIYHHKSLSPNVKDGDQHGNYVLSPEIDTSHMNSALGDCMVDK